MNASEEIRNASRLENAGHILGLAFQLSQNDDNATMTDALLALLINEIDWLSESVDALQG